jgi:UDP:flavonoid glycosyltransferase YjiC (YdhE family)
MKFALAFYGTYGDVDPGVAVGRELMRRGHDVRIAVPPDLVGFAEASGLVAVAYGLDVQPQLDGHRNFWTSFFRAFWRIQELRRLWQAAWEPMAQCWAQMNTTLMALAHDADLMFTGLGYQEPAANVAEYFDIPLATLHWLPLTRANGQILPFLPSPLVRSGMTAIEWLNWRVTKKLDDAQRRELGLPKATGTGPRRIAQGGALEIQAYDEVWFPGLAAEWAEWDVQRPFVGALTTEFATDADDEVASWIAAGTPPIYFGFGSIPVKSPADTVEMISAACAQMGERALVGAGGTDFSEVPQFGHVKVVGAVNYAETLPACRAVVHHGGSGTTAAGLRAGIPTLILWTGPEQMIAGAQIKRLKVGLARRFSATTGESLVADLRQIVAPEYVARAREIATRMTKPAESVVRAADLVEDFARSRCFD